MHNRVVKKKLKRQKFISRLWQKSRTGTFIPFEYLGKNMELSRRRMLRLKADGKL